MPSQAEKSGNEWAPGYLKHIPWTAFSSLAGFILCCIALAVVLWTSDGQDFKTWPRASQTVPVSVLLALIISISNLCLSVALAKGYEISWWLRAIKGAELRSLQFDLEIQHHLSAVIGQNTRMDKFAVAAIISLAVSVLDGPLIQRASSIVATTYQPVDLNVKINISSALFPANFSGYAGAFIGPDLLTPVFGNVSRAYANRESISLDIDVCRTNTTCVFNLPAPGFDVQCTEEAINYDFRSIGAASPNNNVTVFNTSLYFGGREEFEDFSRINITALAKGDPACTGRMMQRNCVLRLATVRYPVTVSDGVATLDAWRMGQNETLDIATDPQAHSHEQLHGYGTLYEGSVGAGGFQTMLGGIYFVLGALYASTVSLRVATMTSVPFILTATGQSASNYLTSDISTYSNCTMTWDDPTTDIVNTARELMFRSAIAYSDYNRSAVVPQELQVRQTKVAGAYKSNYEYLAITIACMVLQALVIAYMLYGWHRLGRDVSLDPFELARAMGAPLLQVGSSNSSIDAALTRLRRERFQYGELMPEARASVKQSQTKHSEAISSVQYDTPGEGRMDSTVVEQKPQLGFDRAERVRGIRPGIMY
ncbi:hypothetical protein PG988_007180 [Apiospora saccharicola]